MLQPKTLDGRAIGVIHWPDGRTFVDPAKAEDGGGPYAVRHFHRWENYHLDGLVRCRVCGEVKEGAIE